MRPETTEAFPRSRATRESFAKRSKELDRETAEHREGETPQVHYRPHAYQAPVK